MDSLQIFLAHAIELERDAARRYEELTAAMRTAGNREVEQFFRQMGEFSRRHLKDAQARGGFHTLPQLRADEWQWPEGCSPEAVDWPGLDVLIDVVEALQFALAGEQRSQAFYTEVAASTSDHEIRRMATEFAEEEGEHVHQLQRWLSRVAV